MINEYLSLRSKVVMKRNLSHSTVQTLWQVFMTTLERNSTPAVVKSSKIEKRCFRELAPILGTEIKASFRLNTLRSRNAMK